MQHPDFVIWMIGYPLLSELVGIARHRFGYRKQYTEDVEGWAAGVQIFIWLFVGYKLF